MYRACYKEAYVKWFACVFVYVCVWMSVNEYGTFCMFVCTRFKWFPLWIRQCALLSFFFISPFRKVIFCWCVFSQCQSKATFIPHRRSYRNMTRTQSNLVKMAIFLSGLVYLPCWFWTYYWLLPLLRLPWLLFVLSGGGASGLFDMFRPLSLTERWILCYGLWPWLLCYSRQLLWYDGYNDLLHSPRFSFGDLCFQSCKFKLFKA